MKPGKRENHKWFVTAFASVFVICLLVITTKRKVLQDLDTTSLGNRAGAGYDPGSSNVQQRVMVITQHGKKSDPSSNNVKVFGYTSKRRSKRWDSIGSLLERSQVVDDELANLRGVLAVGQVLYVVSAYTSHSKIIAAQKCANPDSNKVPQVYYSISNSEHLNHPYDLAMHNSALYVTNQNLNSVVRIPLSKLQPGASASVEQVAKVHQPRGIAFSKNGLLWVASIYDGLLCYRETPDATRELLTTIPIVHPVGVAYDPRTDLLYVGNRVKNHGTARVYVINASERKVLGSLKPPSGKNFQHIAGIAVGNRKLFVIAQKARMVHTFSLEDGSYNGVALKDLPPRPEQIELYYC